MSRGEHRVCVQHRAVSSAYCAETAALFAEHRNLPPIMADTDRGERRRIGAMHANIYRQQQELQKQAAKEFAAINNWRYTAKKSGAWYPRITTERMIFTTTSAHY